MISSIQTNSSALSLQYYPMVTKPGQPFEVTATVTNAGASPHQFSVGIYVNGIQVLDAKSTVDASSTQSFTYATTGPKIGSSARVYAQATDLVTGKVYSQTVMMPPAPPELLMSFASFSSFASSLFSSSSMLSSMSMAYYTSAVGAVSAPRVLVPSSLLAIAISMTIIGLLIYLELTDSVYGRLGSRFRSLRVRFGLLGFTLLLVFGGIVFTRVVMLIVG